MEESEYEARIRNDVETRGWHVCIIAQDDEGPAFAYTVGLHKSFQHPELIIFGLDHGEVGGTMHQVVNWVGDLIKNGQSFDAGTKSDAVLEGFDCVFHSVNKKHYREFFGYAIWFYDGEDFPVHQVFWPDKNGHFPWEPEFAEDLVWFQPELS